VFFSSPTNARLQSLTVKLQIGEAALLSENDDSNIKKPCFFNKFEVIVGSFVFWVDYVKLWQSN
jgi:hypothetical protein